MNNEQTNKEKKMISDIISNIYGIALLLTLSSVMLLVHLYLAFFFHN